MPADRRQFLARTLQGAAVAACGGSVWYGLIAQQAEAAPHVLRPPGATSPHDFAATCAKCGRCVAACPYGTLRLADLAGRGASGLPYFEPRVEPCAMCPDIPCVKACPTGALDRGLTDIAKARMGLAAIDAENCLSWQGLRCEVCYRVCPVKGTAIRIDPHPRQISKHAVFVPVVSSEACTGCGLCEKACPTEVASIRVVQPVLVQGRIGAHYRLGWKHEAGVPAGSAVAPDADTARSAPKAAPRASAKAPGVDYLNQ